MSRPILTLDSLKSQVSFTDSFVNVSLLGAFLYKESNFEQPLNLLYRKFYVLLLTLTNTSI